MKTVDILTFFTTVKNAIFPNTIHREAMVLKKSIVVGLLVSFICVGCAAYTRQPSPDLLGNRLHAVLPDTPDEPLEDFAATQNNLGNTGLKERVPLQFNRTTPYTTPEAVERNDLQPTDRIAYNTRKASRIASAVSRLPGIEKTTVVITGNTALVGIHILSTVADDQVGALKDQVERKVRGMDGEIRNVAVTASPELVERITTMAGDIGQGRPMNGLADELSSVLRRVTPTI